MSQTPLIIDTDPGVDDAYALALASASSEVDLRAVTTVFGNVELPVTTKNACRIMAMCGRRDVPIAPGADRPLVYPMANREINVHGADGLGGRATNLPEPGEHGHRRAVELMAEVLRSAETPVTIAAIGPLTNVAGLLITHPELVDRIGSLVVMGGAAVMGNVTPSAEFNVWADPEAARRVLVESRVPVTLVPLDLTYRCAVRADWLDRLAKSGPVGRELIQLSAVYRNWYSSALGEDMLVLHDAVAVAEAIRPGILRTTRYPVDVDCGTGPARGSTIVDQRPLSHLACGRDVDVALEADIPELREFLLGRLSNGLRIP